MVDTPSNQDSTAARVLSTRQMLEANPWLSALPAEVLDRLVQAARRRRLRDGELLYARGEAADALYGVIGGRIRACATSAEGREITIAYFESGEWLGELSIFDGLPRISDAVAQGDSEVLSLPRSVFQQLLAEQPALYEPFIKILCHKLRLALHFAADLMLLPLPVRLAKRLLDLAEVYGGATDEGILIGLRLPQDELGRMLGVSRQSISKELKNWEAAGWIKIAYGQITLCEPDELRHIGQFPG